MNILKKIFFRKNNTNHKDVLLAELDGFFLEQEQFLGRLREERLRSERSGLPLTLVIMDLEGMLDYMAAAKSFSPNGFLRHLAGTLRNSTRESDVKGWYEQGKIGLLTPYTDLSGAGALVSNLASNLAEFSKTNGSFQKHDFMPFVGLSLLHAGRSYLTRNPDKQEDNFDPSTPQQFYQMEFSTPAAGKLSVSGGSVDLATIEWPFFLEILNQEQSRKLQLLCKRFLDIAGSLVGIVLSVPLMLILAVLIKLTSRGPVLFRQQRLGYLGKTFTFLKFRSMKVDCDSSVHKEYVSKLIEGKNEEINKGTDDSPLYKITNDPRITTVGRFLRKSSLDELPQFFNVLKGDMSLVGPRPPIPYECDVYRRWHCRRVLEAKPGITGMWQVNGRSSTTFEGMVRLDLAYIRNWSLWLDIKIMLKTFWAVLSTKGGY
jgi:lipopolysaccharide/colanic/teichoic acid biosynthesis glycosyltransferase